MGHWRIAVAALVMVWTAPAGGQPAARDPQPASLYLAVPIEDCISHSGTIGVQAHYFRQSCSISLEDCRAHGWRPIHRPSKGDPEILVWIWRIYPPKP